MSLSWTNTWAEPFITLGNCTHNFFYENAFIIKFLINEDFLYFILNNLLNITIF